MTNKETVNRNIGLSFDFVKEVIKTPKIIEGIEDCSTVDFLQKDYPEREHSKKVPADKYIKVKRSFKLI